MYYLSAINELECAILVPQHFENDDVGFRKSEVRCRKSDVGSQKSEVRRSKDKSKKLEVLEIRNQKSEISSLFCSLSSLQLHRQYMISQIHIMLNV